jgi:hypothetical protein
VALVVVAQTDYEHWEPLPETRRAAEELGHALDRRGYELHLRELLGGGTRNEVARTLTEWSAARSPTDRVVLYWAGHAGGNGGRYLMTRDSPRSDISALNALSARDLGDFLARSSVEKLLVLLDTDYSSSAAQDMAQLIGERLMNAISLPVQMRFAAVLGSAQAVEKAYEGAFPRVLLRLLTEPDLPSRPWSDRDPLVRVSELAEALIEELRTELGPAWHPPVPFITGIGDRFLPNPRYRPA